MQLLKQKQKLTTDFILIWWWTITTLYNIVYLFLSNDVYVTQGLVGMLSRAKKKTQFQYLESKFVFMAILLAVGVGAVFSPSPHPSFLWLDLVEGRRRTPTPPGTRRWLVAALPAGRWLVGWPGRDAMQAPRIDRRLFQWGSAAGYFWPCMWSTPSAP